MKEVYIVASCRTPIGKLGGALKGFQAHQLGSIVIKEALKRADISPDMVDEVILGNVLQAGQGQNSARQAAVNAGIPVEKPAATVNKICGSGLYAVSLAYKTILAGEADCVVAGGMESMSNAPYLMKTGRWGHKLGDTALTDSLVNDGLWDAFNDYHMGITAENIAKKFDISREEQDEFSFQSQQKASRAQKSGNFKDEIVSLSIPQRKGEDIIFSEDEVIKGDTTLEKLAKLKPAFMKNGTVTAGNASGINDGAAIIIVASAEFVKANNLKPLAKIISVGSKGVDPAIMGMGPVPSVRDAIRKANLDLKDIDLFELNEAFASQSIGVIKELGIPVEKINVNGGAIALGHPIGASGARILTSLLYQMKRQKAKLGAASLCIGGGMGEAVIVELCN